MASGGSQYYPLPGFMFNVEFTGGNFSGESAFQEVSGLKVNFDVENITVGGILSNTFKLPKVTLQLHSCCDAISPSVIRSSELSPSCFSPDTPIDTW